MRRRWLAFLPFVACPAIWLAARSSPVAQTRRRLAAPPVVLLEGDPDGAGTDVMLRTPGHPEYTRTLGRVPHAIGSARKATVTTWHGALAVLVVAAERETSRGSSFNSALFRVAGGQTVRVVGDLQDASAPMATENGTVIVQRGHDGRDVQPDPITRTFRERTDALMLDAVDLDTFATRTLWSGEGQFAFLGASMRGDEVCVYHASDAGGELFALDASHATMRFVLGPFAPLARDFTFDPVRDEIVFARADRPRSATYEIAAVSADGSQRTRVLYRGENDHLMPYRLFDGTVAFSFPLERGLALIPPGLGVQPMPFARLGEGADAVVAETHDGRWIAVRHTTSNAQSLALVSRSDGATVAISNAERVIEFAGFVPVGVNP